MSTPKFSDDPEQQAEMVAQWHFENRLMGVNPYRDEPSDDYDDYDAPEYDADDFDDYDDEYKADRDTRRAEASEY